MAPWPEKGTKTKEIMTPTFLPLIGDLTHVLELRSYDAVVGMIDILSCILGSCSQGKTEGNLEEGDTNPILRLNFGIICIQPSYRMHQIYF